jgi:phospholipid transport system substrate-binding protein
MIKRRLFIAVTALLALAGTVLTPSAFAQTRSEEASRFVADLGARAIEVLVEPGIGREDQARRFNLLLNEGFDVPYIGRFVLGRYWQAATEAERSEYLELFEKLIIGVYADRFAQYSGRDLKASETLKILGHRDEGERDAIVSSQINRPDGPPVAVDWRVREQRDDGFKVIDVAVEGVSMSVTQRNEFASVIQRGGGRIEALLQALRERVSRT